MKPDVTLHRSLRHRRADAFIITAIALLAATAVALVVLHAPQPAAPPTAPVQIERPAPPPAIATPDLAVSTERAAPPPPRRARRTATHVPLDATPVQEPDGFEVLSAGELETISQADQ
jgi:hypothetical protein